MIPRSVFRLSLAACLLALAAAPAIQAQIPPASPPMLPRTPVVVRSPAPAVGDEYVDFKLHGGDIDAVLDALETYTGKTIIRPGTLPVMTGGFTIDLNHQRKSDAIIALETLLTLNQLGVAPLGDHFLKIVPLSLVKAEAPEYIETSTLDLAPSNKVATKLFQLKFLRVNELFGPTLQSMMSPNIGGGVVVLEKANAALVTDTIANIQRLETLVAAVDHPPTDAVPKFYTLLHAKASDLVTKIHALLSGPIQNRFGTTTTYNADDRTNQVIVLCDPNEVPFFDELIGKLDIKSDPNTRTEVFYLKHADAKDLGTTLSSLVSGQQSASQKNAGSVHPGDINTNPQGQGGAAVNAGAGGGANEFSSLMTVISDERSNSIVVSGTVDDIRLMRDLIDKLDAALPQVRIEVVIAEVTLTDIDQSGISALNLTVGQSASGATHVLNWAGGGTASTGGTSVAGWDFSNGVVNPLAFNAAMNATSVGSKNLVKVLSAPVIVTAHGKQAEVTVGEQVPISSSTTSTPVTGVGTNGFATTGTTSYQTIAIDLKVTPLIGDNGDVQLTIDQQVNDILGNQVLNGNSTPIIGDREAKSYVTVKDGQMIVLGGLQRTSKTTTHNKLGFLFEIPILSQLLGGHEDDLERTELLFFIRPHIIMPDDALADTRRHINEMSNKDQINEYLSNPSKHVDSKTQNFIDRFKSD